jgi:phage tail sheath protein FI
MPEYLAPGVYVEETSYRSKSIEGVSTSTAGFVGPTRFGPVTGEPELLTSLSDFIRIYGNLEDLQYGSTRRTNYLAHAVRAFFEEGGRRLYVQRVFRFSSGFSITSDLPTLDYGRHAISGTPALTLLARFPGVAGNMRITFSTVVGRNVLTTDSSSAVVLNRVEVGDLVYLVDGTNDGLYVVDENATSGDLELRDDVGVQALPSTLTSEEVRPVTLLVEIERPTYTSANFTSEEGLGTFSLNPNRGALADTFTRNPSTRYAALTTPFAIEGAGSLTANIFALELFEGLFPSLDSSTLANVQAAEVTYTLTGGLDGQTPTSTQYEGIEDTATFSDYVNQDEPLMLAKNGLLSFEGIENISIVAAPGYSDGTTEDAVFAIHNAVVAHCESMRYRIAVLDTPPNLTVTEALDFRNRRSSEYGALYYPWIVVSDPTPGRANQRLKLPPSGFVAGIYARNDTEHAVFKAPANEVVRLAIDFEQLLTKAQQEVLNPEGVNCFRFFEGRGYLLWGARTISDDPEWKYVNLRRYFAYLEYSIDRGTQWAVFMNNDRHLWANVRQTIEDFLFNEWRSGGLMGEKPEEAYFVRCDRSTMTQNDLDNGRLICLIGVAPVRPAEFVIFRIGQWTADSNR